MLRPALFSGISGIACLATLALSAPATAGNAGNRGWLHETATVTKELSRGRRVPSIPAIASR